MTSDEALDRLVAAARSARPGGVRVREWSVHVAESRRASIGTQDAHTGGPHSPLGIAEALSARWHLVWEDGRVVSSDLDRTAIEEGLGEAIERARAAAREDPDAAQVAPPARMPDVSLLDSAAARMAAGDLAPLAGRLRAIRDRLASHGFRTWSGSFHATHTTARIVTSSGLDASSESTLAGWHATFDGELGNGHVARAQDGDAEFEVRLDRLADLAARLRLPAPPGGARSRLAVLHPAVVRSLVFGTLLHNLDGAAVAHGESRFPAKAFGSRMPVFPEGLSLRVEPLEPLKAGSYRFTLEGVPAAPTTFVDRGRLVTPVLGLKYARRLGGRPTGIPVASDALRLSGPPAIALEEALESAPGGTLVLAVLGVHTQDRASGDFSLSAPQALAIAGGSARGRLRVTMSGNVFEVLADDALRLVRFPGEDVPGLRIRCAVENR